MPPPPHPFFDDESGMPPPPPPPWCSPPSGAPDNLHLRIASIFIIMFGSLVGALCPIIVKPKRPTKRNLLVYDTFKYVGSGVIIATAFIHLLTPAFENLRSECLHGKWADYPWAPALAMCSVFAVFFVELAAFRIGTARLAHVRGGQYDPHGHGISGPQTAAHGPELSSARPPPSAEGDTRIVKTASATTDAEAETTTPVLKTVHDPEAGHEHVHFLTDSAWAQLVGVAILEFGIVFHSILIGLTLAVSEEFIPLFVVISLHQTFEGLGLGARLSSLSLPPGYNWVPYGGALTFGLTTPLGIAVGLAARGTYAPEGETASIVSGVFDAVSAGILLYTGLVELLAHEFLFNPQVAKMSNMRLLYACGCIVFGAALMSLLGRWA